MFQDPEVVVEVVALYLMRGRGGAPQKPRGEMIHSAGVSILILDDSGDAVSYCEGSNWRESRSRRAARTLGATENCSSPVTGRMIQGTR